MAEPSAELPGGGQGSVALLRGINVGGKNLIRMPELAQVFRDTGCERVSTYIQSGNVLFWWAGVGGAAVEDLIERAIERRFGLSVMVVVRSREELAATIAAAPTTHGSSQLRSDVIFLKHPADASAVFAGFPEPREGVDAMALGPGAIYFSRVAERATQSRLSRIVTLPSYKLMTVRNWRTTTRLLALLDGS